MRRLLALLERRHGRLKGIELRNTLPPNPTGSGAMTTRRTK